MSSLTIIPRKVWNPIPRGGPVERRAPSSIRELFVHWPGGVPSSWQFVNTEGEERTTIRGFQIQHIRNNGWSDIGYNHVLAPNWGRPGEVPNIYTARGAQYTPAAQLHHNTGTIAICVLMGPNDPLLESVKARLRSYVRWVEDYAGHEVAVRGHRDAVSTDCPGPKLYNYVKTLDKV